MHDRWSSPRLFAFSFLSALDRSLAGIARGESPYEEGEFNTVAAPSSSSCATNRFDLAASMSSHSSVDTSSSSSNAAASVPCTPAAYSSATEYSRLHQQRSLHATNPQAEGYTCGHAEAATRSAQSPPCTPAPAVPFGPVSASPCFSPVIDQVQGRFASAGHSSPPPVPLSHSSLVHSPDATAAGVVYPYSAMRAAAPAASLSFLSPICATPGGLADRDQRALLLHDAPTPSFAHCSPEAPSAGHAALAAPAAADQSVSLSDVSYWLADLQHRNHQMQQQLLNTSRHLQNLIPSA